MADDKTPATRVDAQERKPVRRDLWDKLDVLAKVLMPLTVAAAGFFFSRALKERDISAAAELKERDIAVASVNSRVQQAALINTFMEALVSGSAPRRQLAISAIMIALPQDGPDLVRVVSSSEKDGVISQIATDALVQRRDDLIHRLFADSADVRIAASDGLLQGWRSRPDLVPALLDTARRRLDNLNGVYNTLGVLAGMDRVALKVHRPAVEAFARDASKGSSRERIRGLAEQVRQRAGG